MGTKKKLKIILPENQIMKLKLVVLLFLFTSIYKMAGQDAQGITISFNNVPLKEAILQLEEQTASSFFFEETWLNNHFVTKSFDRQPINAILDGILQNTNINYFIKDL